MRRQIRAETERTQAVHGWVKVGNISKNRMEENNSGKTGEESDM